MTDISTPVDTHIPGPPVSQNVINRAEQQVLSLCLLLTANYEALQVCPANHTCNAKLIRYQPLLPCFALCSLFSIFLPLLEVYAFSHTHVTVIKSTSSCGYDSVHQLCYPPGASARAPRTTGERGKWRYENGQWY